MLFANSNESNVHPGCRGADLSRGVINRSPLEVIFDRSDDRAREAGVAHNRDRDVRLNAMCLRPSEEPAFAPRRGYPDYRSSLICCYQNIERQSSCTVACGTDTIVGELNFLAVQEAWHRGAQVEAQEQVA